ncbi:MAG: hypothetical protein WBL25_13175 [Anaerolineales bacterium]
MATPQTYQKSFLPLRVAKSPRNLAGISKLFEAAVVNRQFCQLLLSQPETALKQGYLGNSFELTREEQALIISIRANSLPDLAQQVTTVLG